MDNSLVHAFEGYVRAVFKDIAPTYGSLRDLDRDLNRSLHELGRRGVRFLTIDLPALRKHFDKCLEEGTYTPSNLYLSRMVSKRIQVPAFGRSLYLRIFDTQGKLRSNPDTNAIADIRQLFEGVGKLFQLCKQEYIDDEIENFIITDRELRRPTLAWESDDLFEVNTPRSVSFCDVIRNASVFQPSLLPDEPESGLSGHELQTLQRVCDIVSASLGDFHVELDEEGISERPKHGTGRVSNLKKSHSKYDFSKWPLKLDRIFPYDWYATSDLGVTAYFGNPSRPHYINSEDPSKLIAVPKTQSGPRLIGSEPNYHLWIQQLVRVQIENRIKKTPLRHCISFGNQQPNRDLALSSSIDQYYCTVDLKSASDRLSCWTIERVFRSNITLLERIHASRTRTMKVTLRNASSILKLKKCFTQGSACTFPVQTVAYSIVAIAAIIISDGMPVNSMSITRAARQTRVFGDDIIVPTFSLPKLTEILELLQLKVNSTKTFHKGKFRESCGLDAFDGVIVTPARLRAFSVNPSHEVASSMLEGSNNFFKRGMWHVSEWIMTYLRRYDLPVMSIHGSGGLLSFTGFSVEHLQKRYNKTLHRNEVKYHVLTSNSKKVPTQSAYDITEYLFSNKPRSCGNLDYLDPTEGGLGVVNKKASVMKRGWRFLSES